MLWYALAGWEGGAEGIEGNGWNGGGRGAGPPRAGSGFNGMEGLPPGAIMGGPAVGPGQMLVLAPGYSCAVLLGTSKTAGSFMCHLDMVPACL